MTSRAMLRKIRLDGEALARIAAAVKAAEARTSGEIALALTAESAAYSFWELLFAVTGAACVFCLLLPAAGAIRAALERALWEPPLWALPAVYGAAAFGSAALLFALANIPALDRLIVPRRARESAARRRAARHFWECGAADTADRAGVLIFMSYLERDVRIIAGSGLNGKAAPAEWNAIAEECAAGIGGGGAAQAFIRAVERCGDVLARHFPARADNPNELSDQLVILEDSVW